MSSDSTIEVGQIYKIAADEANGITPPVGRQEWYKHFVVMGKAEDGSVYGCVVFDSEINRDYVGPGDEEFYLPIKKGSYNFIDHDSYLECLKLKPATAEKLLNGKFEGTLSEEHMAAAKNLVKLSRRHNFITLKLYGII